MVLKTLLEAYNYLDNDAVDPRSRQLLWIPSIIQFTAMLSAYLYFVKVFGPRMMRDRQAFKIDGIIIIYNILQIMSNLFLFINGILIVTDEQFSWRCEAIDYSNNARALKISRDTYVFFLIKATDLLDTVFFVLRKKNNQATFLHVYHHIGIYLGGWLCVRYFPGGQPIFLGLINTFIHCIMYAYYLFTVLKPDYKNFAWWKKYITQMQMIQFLLIALHSSQLLFHNPCSYPVYLTYLLIGQNGYMFYLFYGFYKKAYWSKKKTS